MFSLLTLLKNNEFKLVENVENLLNKYSNRNYPEFEIIRNSIEIDKE